MLKRASDPITTNRLASILLWLPAVIYVASIGRWSLDLDEIYTLRDSQAAVSQILTYEKPIYYLICHYILQLNLSDEVAIRLPAALAAGAIPPVCYLMLRRLLGSSVAWFTAILVAANPWYFQLSQFGRFYSLLVLLSMVAIFCLYRGVIERRLLWLVAFCVAALLATATHTTAIILFPAGICAAIATARSIDPRQVTDVLWRNRKTIAITVALAIVVLLFQAAPSFRGWIQARHGQFGNYEPTQVLMGFVAFTGLQVWALALLPLLKPLRQYSREEIFFLAMLLCSTLPYVLVAKLGGGVAPRYLLSATPSLFVLAGLTWKAISERIDSTQLKVALGAALLALNVPMLLSTLREGNHCDYRSAVAFVEDLGLVNPLVACSAHKLYSHYATEQGDVSELSMVTDWTSPPSSEGSAAQQNLLKLIEQAKNDGRSLVLVSREDRRAFAPSVQRWFAEHFVVLTTIERLRFDHRRNQMVVYQYRPL